MTRIKILDAIYSAKPKNEFLFEKKKKEEEDEVT